MCLSNSLTSICQKDISYLASAKSRLHLAPACVDKILDAAITQGISPAMLSTDPDFVVNTLAPVACLPYIDDYPFKIRAKFVDALRFAFRQAVKFNRLPPSLLLDHHTQRDGRTGPRETSKSTPALSCPSTPSRSHADMQQRVQQTMAATAPCTPASAPPWFRQLQEDVRSGALATPASPQFRQLQEHSGALATPASPKFRQLQEPSSALTTSPASPQYGMEPYTPTRRPSNKSLFTQILDEVTRPAPLVINSPARARQRRMEAQDHEEAGLNASLAGLSVGDSLDPFASAASAASTASDENLTARQPAGRVVAREQLAAQVNRMRSRLESFEEHMVSALGLLRQDLADMSDMLGARDEQAYM
ncbi:hypothetical protein QBC39DRAFT_361611 [Podospora conica]|nr:hypothetical protein QBC39DRAFT_361611 [Schizothecium conicum]